MNRARLIRLITLTLVLALLLTAAPAPQPFAGVERVEAAFLGPNAVLGLFRIGGALGQRNRVYREAGATAAEINTYYDGLIARAQSVRQGYITGATTGERAPQFAPAYTRVEAALQAERRAAIQMIEAEKNQARRDFNRKLGKEIANILIASPGGQRIIGQIRETIKGAQEAAIAVRVAANEGRPIEALGNALAKQAGDMRIAQEAARALGSAVGHGLDRALGGAIGKVERAIDDIQAEMGAAIDVLDEMDATVGRYDGQERRPVSLVEDDTVIGKLIPVDRSHPVVDVAASAYAGASALAGALDPGTSRGAMRDRIRGALLDERLSGIRNLAAGSGAGQSYCSAVGRGEYEAAARALGQTPQTASDPEQAVYLVCYDVQTRAPQYARLLGVAVEEAVEGEAGGAAAAIPADTYLGTTNWLQAADPSWGPERYSKNELLINVAVDGTVSGSYTVNYAYGGYNEHDDCSWRWEYDIRGVFSGQLLEAQGIIDVAETFSTEIYTDCPTRGSGYSIPINRQMDVQISGDQMTGTTRRIPEDDKLIWSFSATKQ